MRTLLRVLVILAILGILALAVFILWPLDRTRPEEIALGPDSMAWPEVAEADYPHLAMLAGDCAACHTSDEGGERFAGGRGFPTPMGTVYSTNITPDPETGIGNYTLDEFRAAVVDGIRQDGAHLYPAMPYANFRHMAERDVEALYDYFMNEVEPVHAANRDPEMTFPFNLRFGIRAWKWLALPDPGFTPPADPVLARGAYLVEGPEHCGACHTPRNALFVEQGYTAADPEFLAGSVLNGWPVPSLRGEDGAPARWSEQALRSYLRTGRNRHDATTNEMTLVIFHSLQHLPDSDIDAIVAYLRAIAPNGGGQETAPPADVTAERVLSAVAEGGTAALLSSADPTKLDLGARLYLDNCSACHMIDGEGGGSIIPDLNGNPLVNAEETGGLLGMILGGHELPSTGQAPLEVAMPGFAPRLSNEEVAALASFVRSAWSNDAAPIEVDAVAEAREGS